MKGPRYLTKSPYIVKLKEKDYERHQKGLENIASFRNFRASLGSPPLDIWMNHLHEKNNHFHNSEKLNEINKQNHQFLDKLMNIANGKIKSSVPEKAVSKSTQAITLHESYRKKEAGRIARENIALAKRILDSNALISRKKLRQDYEKNLEVRKIMLRLDPTPRGSKKTIKFPSISKTPSGSETKFHTEGNEKKDKIEAPNHRSEAPNTARVENSGTKGEHK